MTNNQVEQQNPKFILTIIWGALLFSMFLYLYIVETMVPSDNVAAPELDLMFQILAGIGIICAFVSQFFFQKAIKTINAALESRLSRESGIQKAFPMLIISWAIGESIAVFGLVLGFNGMNMDRVYSFFAAAILLHLFRHPFRL